MRASGRARRPTCVVKIRSVLRFIASPRSLVGPRRARRQVQCVVIRLSSRATARSDGDEIIVGYRADVAGA